MRAIQTREKHVYKQSKKRQFRCDSRASHTINVVRDGETMVVLQRVYGVWVHYREGNTVFWGPALIAMCVYTWVRCGVTA